MEAYINDDRGQIVGSVELKPGKNIVTDEQLKEIEKDKWGQFLISKGLLSIGQERPSATLEDPLPEVASIIEEPKIETPVIEVKTEIKE